MMQTSILEIMLGVLRDFRVLIAIVKTIILLIIRKLKKNKSYEYYEYS
jgi:hypothetical protein